MKKTNNIIAKSLSLVMFTSILGTSLPIQAVQAATKTSGQSQQFEIKDENILYEDDTFKVTQSDNTRIALNKETNHKVVLTFDDYDNSKGTFTNIDGSEQLFSIEKDGNIFLDDECFIETSNNKSLKKNNLLARQSGYTNSKHFKGKDGFTYYYVTTNTYNTKVTGDAESIALGILGFMPYVGPIFGVASIIETVKNFGADTVYIVEEQYCTSDYSHYAYKNSFYSDKKLKNKVGSNTVYKKMF
jgi:hypothetical protein